MAFLLKHYTFSAKIRNLNDYHQRVLTNNQPPSGLDVVNTLRYFQQTLLGFLKDVQNPSSEIFESQRFESERLALFPNLNYSGLYFAICNIIEIFPQISSGQIILGSAILSTLNCLYLFLDRDNLEQLPYLLSTLLATFPDQLHDEVMHSLCNVMLPFAINKITAEETSVSGASAVMLTVFHYSPNPEHHSWLVETLMSFRSDVFKDVLAVIACGTSESRVPAANLLFHYWPLMNPNILDRRSVQYRPQAWHTIKCQHKNCATGENNTVTHKCLDPKICAEVADSAPPVYVCQQCADNLKSASDVSLFEVTRPMSTTSHVCQAKGCKSTSRMAVATCFSPDCIRHNGMEPIKYCQACHEANHLTGDEAVRHVFHQKIPSPWDLDNYTYVKFVEAVVRLLKECSFMVDADQEKRPRWLQQIEGAHDNDDAVMADEKRMLSRYGIWLLVGLCTPREDTPEEAIGHLLAMLFQWFGTTALLPNDQTGTALEHLKSDFVCDWLPKVIKSHYNSFVNSLLPHPPEYARVGGQWDALSTHTDQLKEGLSRILALIPYDIIDFRTWDKIMPYWLDSVTNEVPSEDLPELKVLMCKIFEVDMCALPFPPEQIYHFIEARLSSGEHETTLQALDWIQLLSEINIHVPTETLLSFFSIAVKAMKEVVKGGGAKKRLSVIPRQSLGEAEDFLYDDDLRPTSPGSPEDSPSFVQRPQRGAEMDEETDSNATMFVMMLDILSKQMDLAEIPRNLGTADKLSQKILLTITDILKAPWTGTHLCDNPEFDDFVDCVVCRETTLFFELLLDTVERICPKDAVKIEMQVDEDYDSMFNTVEESEDQTQNADQTGSLMTPGTMTDVAIDIEGMGHPSAVEYDENGQAIQKIFTATETCDYESMEFAGLLPSEEVETAIAEAVTLTETDVGLATCKVITATLVDEHDHKVQQTPGTSDLHFWVTSQGKFRFTLEELPAQLQFIYALMLDIDKHPDPDVIYYILLSVKQMSLHAEALNSAHRENRGFLIWAQENILIPKFWKLLQAEYSHVSEVCVPLILHCLTLPCGADTFWKCVNEDFNSDDWTIRFAAVEKVTVIARFLDPGPVRGNTVIQAGLANAFCYLIAAVHDPNTAVAQRTLIYLETIKATALKCLCGCLEVQFDAAIVDRPLIIHRLFLLGTLLPDQLILGWDFFLQRFDALSMEAQLQLEKTGEIAYPTDLMHTDPMSDLYQRKLTRARNAVEQIETVRSIVRSMEKALAYQRSLNTSIPVKLSKEEPRRAADRSSDGGGSSHSRLNNKASSAYVEPQTALGKLKEFTDKESNFAMMLNKAMDLENTERHTMYLMITLYMKFLSNPKTAVINPDEKAAAKKQSIVLRHLGALLGYSGSEKCFTVPPSRLRVSAVSNAFLSTLPQVLDNNLEIGNQIMPLACALLQFLPSPQKYASDYQPPTYSLWFLDQSSRYNWLWVTMLVLYKYRFDQAPISEMIVVLVQLVLNTLEAQVHMCEKIESAYHSPIFSRSNDSSPKSHRALLRCSLRRVLLMVRVVRNWPRGERLLHSFDKTESPPSPVSLFSPTFTIDTDNPAPGVNCLTTGDNTNQQLSSPDKETNSPLATHKQRRLRGLLHTVLLMVRVMRQWPHKTPPGTPPQTATSSGESSKSSDEENDETGGNETEVGTDTFSTPVTVRSMPSSAVSRRKVITPVKQPTFDEREEQMLEEFGAGEFTTAQVSVQRGLMSLDTQHEELELLPPAAKVESRILEQISAFDRSFSSSPAQGFIPISSPKSSPERDHVEMMEESAPMAMAEMKVFKPTIVEPDRHHFQLISGDSNGSKGDGELILSHSVTASQVHVVEPSYHQADLSRPVIMRGDSSWEPQKATAFQATLVQPNIIHPREMSFDTGETANGRPMLIQPQMVQISTDSSSREGSPSTAHLRPTAVEVVHRTQSLQSAVVDSSSQLCSASVSVGPSIQVVQPKVCRLQSLSPPAQYSMSDSVLLHPSLCEPEVVHLHSIGGYEDNEGSGRSTTKPRFADVADFVPKRERKMMGSAHERSLRRKERKAAQYEPPQPVYGSLRYAETTVVTRCTQCGAPLEFYDEDTISLAVVCLSTFIHREPSMAAPYLLRMLETVARVVGHIFYPWQGEGTLFVPGNCRSVAKQFVRVVLHQLAPNRLFLELFQSDIVDPDFFKTVASCLADFPELNPVQLISLLLENISEKWLTQKDHLQHIFYNLADYIQHVPTDNYMTTWNNVFLQFDAFLRRYTTDIVELSNDLKCLIDIITHLFKVQNFSTSRVSIGMIDPISKILSNAFQNSQVELKQLLQLCTACNRAFSKERDRQAITRCAINELINALKLKSTISEENYLTLIRFILQDMGEPVIPEIDKEAQNYNSNAVACATPFLQDFIDYISDLNVLHKTKTMTKSGFHEDTLGGEVKAALAQFVASVISSGSGKDPRTVLRYLPWLFSPPSVTQQGPNEFLECVAHLRLMSWLLLGALLHTGSAGCYPIPLDASHYVSDHIQFVLAGFAEQSKEQTVPTAQSHNVEIGVNKVPESVLHMSALFHAFHLCQAADRHPNNDSSSLHGANVMDFWARITPAVLQLLSHSKVDDRAELADMVNLHFLNTIEALQECNSGILAKLYAMWQPVLLAYHVQVPGHLVVRLDACENQVPTDMGDNRVQLRNWLRRIKFKISQIEVQSAAATQFYSV